MSADARVVHVDPEEHDDTELGSVIRHAYARGYRVVVLLRVAKLEYCERCDVFRRPQESCLTCGDEETG